LAALPAAQGDNPMSKVIIAHAVEDMENWLRRRPQRVADLVPFADSITDLVANDGSLRVAVALEVHDLVGLRAAMANLTPERAASIAEQGIVAPFTVYEEAP
jgi:hypothetical protein